MSSTIKATVDQQFSAVAANYTASPVHAQGEDLARMVDLANPEPAWRVLDAGCGAGHTALTFAPHVAHVTGIDLSEAMLAQCWQNATARNLTNVDFRQGDVEALLFDDNAFDLVVSRYSAHHWPQPQQALAEFARVLKPGGRLLLSDIVAPDEPLFDTFLQTLEMLRDPSHVRDHSVAQWRRMFEQARFTVGDADAPALAWRVPLPFDNWVERIRTPSTHVTALRSLYDGASADVRAEFEIEQNYAFKLRGAIVAGKRAE